LLDGKVSTEFAKRLGYTPVVGQPAMAGYDRAVSIQPNPGKLECDILWQLYGRQKDILAVVATAYTVHGVDANTIAATVSGGIHRWT